MKALLQRVSKASITVNNEIVGAIDQGILVFIGFGAVDMDRDALLPKLRDKILTLRIFPNEKGKFDQSVVDIDGGILLVSQFTLYGTCNKGRRPDFNEALQPDRAEAMYDEFCKIFKEAHPKVETGIFGADMKVELLNDGPVTIEVEM